VTAFPLTGQAQAWTPAKQAQAWTPSTLLIFTILFSTATLASDEPPDPITRLGQRSAVQRWKDARSEWLAPGANRRERRQHFRQLGQLDAVLGADQPAPEEAPVARQEPRVEAPHEVFRESVPGSFGLISPPREAPIEGFTHRLLPLEAEPRPLAPDAPDEPAPQASEQGAATVSSRPIAPDEPTDERPMAPDAPDITSPDFAAGSAVEQANVPDDPRVDALTSPQGSESSPAVVDLNPESEASLPAMDAPRFAQLPRSPVPSSPTPQSPPTRLPPASPPSLPPETPRFPIPRDDTFVPPMPDPAPRVAGPAALPQLKKMTDIQPFRSCSTDGSGVKMCPPNSAGMGSDRCPEQQPLPVFGTTERNFIDLEYCWDAPNLFHNPLYFEDVPLERYGHTYCEPLQSVASVTKFGVQFIGIPYQMALAPVHKCESPLGYYRPGDPAPYKCYQIPFNASAALKAAYVYTGLSFITP
jgi:hypothetical protein